MTSQASENNADVSISWMSAHLGKPDSEGCYDTLSFDSLFLRNYRFCSSWQRLN